MKKLNAVFVGLLCSSAGAHATETNIVLDATCPTTPQVVLDQASFCNASPINISGPGAASVYPSSLVVAGLSGAISDVQVRMLNASHTNTSNVQAILQPPTGSPIGLTGGVPIFNPPFPVATSGNWTFSDGAADYALFFVGGVPVRDSPAPTDGTYLPRTFTMLNFPAPAPTARESQLLASQNDRNPNGTWQLFVNHSSSSSSGAIAGGWCVDITTTPSATGCYGSASMTGAIDSSDAIQVGRVNRSGGAALCPWPKANTSTGSTMVRYDTFNFTNPTSQQTCFTLTADFTGCAGNQTQPVVYTSFNPLSPGNNILADSGRSTVGRLQTSFRRGPGEAFTVVAHELNPNTGCPAYTLVLEYNSCNGTVPDFIFANGFD